MKRRLSIMCQNMITERPSPLTAQKQTKEVCQGLVFLQIAELPRADQRRNL